MSGTRFGNARAQSWKAERISDMHSLYSDWDGSKYNSSVSSIRWDLNRHLWTASSSCSRCSLCYVDINYAQFINLSSVFISTNHWCLQSARSGRQPRTWARRRCLKNTRSSQLNLWWTMMQIRPLQMCRSISYCFIHFLWNIHDCALYKYLQQNQELC